MPHTTHKVGVQAVYGGANGKEKKLAQIKVKL